MSDTWEDTYLAIKNQECVEESKLLREILGRPPITVEQKFKELALEKSTAEIEAWTAAATRKYKPLEIGLTLICITKQGYPLTFIHYCHKCKPMQAHWLCDIAYMNESDDRHSKHYCEREMQLDECFIDTI